MRYAAIAAGVAVAAIVAGLVAGCGNAEAKFYGKAVPEEMALTTIERVVAEPARHEGQLVVLEGLITSECPSGCWFWLQDESGQVYVTTHAANFAIPQHVQKKARVYGRVVLEEGRPQLVALGVRLM
jgi:uncharacterized protein YdeI (BOF family)